MRKPKSYLFLNRIGCEKASSYYRLDVPIIIFILFYLFIHHENAVFIVHDFILICDIICRFGIFKSFLGSVLK
jgi:hypothetical protein